MLYLPGQVDIQDVPWPSKLSRGFEDPEPTQRPIRHHEAQGSDSGSQVQRGPTAVAVHRLSEPPLLRQMPQAQQRQDAHEVRYAGRPGTGFVTDAKLVHTNTTFTFFPWNFLLL